MIPQRSALGRLLALGIAAAFLSGCGVSRPSTPWAAGDQPLDATAAARLIEQARTGAAEVRSYRGLFQTVVRRGGAATSFRQAFVFESPDALRVEVLPNQGALSLYLLVSRAGAATALEPAEKRAYTGRSSTAFFRQHLDVPFREREIMALVSGRLEPESAAAPIDARCGESECTMARRDGRYVWRIDRAHGELRGVSIRDPLKLIERAAVRYESFSAVDGVSVPARITVTLPDDAVTIELTRQMGSVNRPIKAALFEVAIPSDYTRITGVAR